MKVAIYCRVSRDDLNNANQKKVLDEWVTRQNIIDAVYFEEQLSSRKTRPVKESVLQLFRSGKIDTIVVTRIDRWARSLQELVMDIEYIINNNGRFIAVMNGFDFDKKNYNASQQLMLNIFSSFAQFEREMIRERTIEGLMRVKAQGKKLGRKSKLDIIMLEKDRNSGLTYSEIAKKYCVSKTAVIKRLKNNEKK